MCSGCTDEIHAPTCMRCVQCTQHATETGVSEILGGTVADNWGHAKSEYDNLAVNSIQLVTTGPNQTVTVWNINLVIIHGAPTASL